MKAPVVTLNGRRYRYRVEEDGPSIIDAALEILDQRLVRETGPITSSNLATTYLQMKLGCRERETFAAMFLDNKHRLIEYVELFEGTINQAAVYPREVARAALLRNAAAVIVAHNHPSGDPRPSEADIMLTRRLDRALALIEIRLLDHIVVGGRLAVSLADAAELNS